MQSTTQYEVVVVGAGPAGLMAAATAAKEGRDSDEPLRVLLLEKNGYAETAQAGKKMLLAGNGRCNVTNAKPVDEMIERVVQNKRFLFTALTKFDAEATRKLLKELGLETVVEADGRVFPASNRSQDVVRALVSYATSNSVKIKRCLVKEIQKTADESYKISGISNDKKVTFVAKKLVLATGGYSYPETGSTGEGHLFAKKLGHTIIPVRAALAPLHIDELWIRNLQGLSLQNVVISLANKKFQTKGELIFTHKGISGPAVLKISCHYQHQRSEKQIVTIDLLPNQSKQQIHSNIQQQKKNNGKKTIVNALKELLPEKLVKSLLAEVKVNDGQQLANISNQQLTEILKILKDLNLTIKRLENINKATVTAGGISVKEISPSTMESKINRGLYIVGELLDVHAYTGGYNIQIALSTGQIAGASAASNK